MKSFSVVAVAVGLLEAVAAQGVNASLPIVDLGYQLHQAYGFNVSYPILAHPVEEQKVVDHRDTAQCGESGGFYNFSNIRYAAPPVGELRFAVPQEPAVNRSAVNIGDVGSRCPQATPAWSAITREFLLSLLTGAPFNATTYVPPGANASSPAPPAGPLETEDCLFLDVFAPKAILDKANSSSSGAPVLVWIYGGGYTVGDKYNNPAGLLAASGNTSLGEIVYVSLNYRLGALGWMGGPDYQSEGGTSNLGLYDQRFALEWVQKNIHLFGGDPKQVTVFGESAGGGSIMHQITAYGGEKGAVPFQKAVPQSPGWSPISSQSVQDDNYRKFLELTNSTSLADLRALSSEAVIKANKQQVMYEPTYGQSVYGPAVDGDFVPLQPGQLLAQGRFAKDVQVMVGHNAEEGALFTPPFIQSSDDLESFIRTNFRGIPQESVDYITETLYPAVFDGSLGYTNQFERADIMVSDLAFTCNTNYLSTGFDNKTYSYLFAVPPALHGFDVPYTFYDGGALSLPGQGVTNRTVAIALQDFITSFAMTGVPEAEGVKHFNMYGPDARVLELNITGIEEIRDSNAGPRCNNSKPPPFKSFFRPLIKDTYISSHIPHQLHIRTHQLNPHAHLTYLSHKQTNKQTVIMFRAQITRQVRLFSTSPIVRKSPVETVKDAAKTVDRTISDQVVKGIEKGEEVTQKVKEAVPESTGEAKGQANQAAGQAKGKASEVAGEAKGKAQELKGEAKGKAQQL
ncbi:unnamed protein product [Periconia digitata]|uniref:Carboxylesterase type B domain-containing protein n=1 Tax=Periconia digitata TaxID=1303443 RepID=A0A9W4XNY8_9PLEO|nr:unnamed protein product [Periconia digitata]